MANMNTCSNRCGAGGTHQHHFAIDSSKPGGNNRTICIFEAVCPSGYFVAFDFTEIMGKLI